MMITTNGVPKVHQQVFKLRADNGRGEVICFCSENKDDMESIMGFNGWRMIGFGLMPGDASRLLNIALKSDRIGIQIGRSGEKVYDAEEKRRIALSCKEVYENS